MEIYTLGNLKWNKNSKIIPATPPAENDSDAYNLKFPAHNTMGVPLSLIIIFGIKVTASNVLIFHVLVVWYTGLF